MAHPLIILGASARAAAQSAIRAGFTPYCIDLFADRDLQAIATVKRCPADQYPAAMIELMRDFPPGEVLLTGAMENHIDELTAASLRAGGSLFPFTNLSTSMQAARLPTVFSRQPDVPGIRKPLFATRWLETPTFKEAAASGSRFLLKPLKSAGGRGIHFWNGLDTIDCHHYVQQFIEGTPIGAVFAGPRFIGASVQIIGDSAFNAGGYTYAGNISPLALNKRQHLALERLGRAVATDCDLHGVFGIDAILDPTGDLWPIEVNPRYTASVEILERALNVTALSPHRVPPPPSPETLAVSQLQHGKAIVFAKHNLIALDLYEFFTKHEIADVPAIGEPIQKGHPICTVFAQEETHDQCLSRLRDMAERLYTRLRP